MNPRSPGGPWPASLTWYDITLPTPAGNLALDEILLNEVDADPGRAILRTWEPSTHFVVVGRSNQVDREVDAVQCRRDGIPVFRRTSGGGAVVVGPGCLAYALALPLTDELRSAGVTAATKLVMQTIAAGLAPLLPSVAVCGTSDLALDDRKFSGNSQRWLRQAFLHHGTILYDFDLPRIGRLLRFPTRQPDYRSSRSHGEFVANVPAPRHALVDGLVAAWCGQPQDCPSLTLQNAQSLARSRYERDDWNLER